jgi:hypothetical protein
MKPGNLRIPEVRKVPIPAGAILGDKRRWGARRPLLIAAEEVFLCFRMPLDGGESS